MPGTLQSKASPPTAERAETAARGIRAEGIRFFFGIPGVQNLAIYSSLEREEGGAGGEADGGGGGWAAPAVLVANTVACAAVVLTSGSFSPSSPWSSPVSESRSKYSTCASSPPSASFHWTELT